MTLVTGSRHSCHVAGLSRKASTLCTHSPRPRCQRALAYLREEDGLEPWTVPGVWLINSPGREVNHYVDIIGTSGRKVAAVTPALGARGYPSRPENTPQGRFATPDSESGGSSGQVAVRHPPR